MEESVEVIAPPHPAIDNDPVRAVRGHTISRVLLAVGVIAGGLLTLLHVRQPDGLTALTVIPAWCWLMAALILLLETRPVYRSLPWVLCLATTLLYGGLCVEQTQSLLRGPFRLPARNNPGGSDWRIVSLNCFVGTPEVAADLKPWEPDLVLLQESPSDAALRDIARDLFGAQGAYLSTGDCSILARGELELVPASSKARYIQARWTPPTEPTAMVFSLRLSPPPTRLDLWRPASWRIHRLRREVQRAQIDELAAAITLVPAGMPIIVGGDCNSPARDAAHRPLDVRLRDSFAVAGRGWGGTFIRGFPFHRLDQVWVSSELQPLRSGAMVAEHSDHRAAICDLAHAPK